MGWKFCFQYNGGKYYKTVPEMQKWLNTKGIKIVNEYGETVSRKKFWEIIEIKQKEPHRQHDYDTQCFEVDGYKFLDCEFC